MSELRDLQRRIAAVRAERGFTTDPVRLLALLVEEVGEVAGELKKTWSANYPDLVVDELADELADVFVLLSALASEHDIDLGEAVTTKFFERDSTRQWASAGQPPEND